MPQTVLLSGPTAAKPALKPSGMAGHLNGNGVPAGRDHARASAALSPGPCGAVAGADISQEDWDALFHAVEDGLRKAVNGSPP